MNETMYDCYLSQFDCMKKILTQHETLFSGFVNAYLSLKPDRLYLVGSGTSRNACAAAADYMEEMLGVEVSVEAPSRVSKLYGERPMAIAISQTGRSINTINAVERMRGEGAFVVTLSDPKETVLGKAGDLAISLEADLEPIGQRTRGYTASILTLYLMALDAGIASGILSRESYERQISNLYSTVESGPNYLECCQDFYDRHLVNLKKATNFIFVGKGAAGKVAEEDALKVLETICYPSSGYEFEEFLHGPICNTRDNLALFLFLPEDEDNQRMLKLAELVGKVTPNCYLVSHDGSVNGERVLQLTSPDPIRLSPFTDILFGQLISAKLPTEIDRGRLPVVMEIAQNLNYKLPRD